MAKCAYCSSTILIGGRKRGALRFCNDKCVQQGVLLPALGQIPRTLLDRQILLVHEGRCPKCNGSGPVDVHTSYSIWSMVVLTSWYSTPQISCRKCGIKAKVRDGLASMLVGWWGFPFGIILTPVQVIRNFAGIFSSPGPAKPSKALEKIVGLRIVATAVRTQEQGATQPEN